MVDCDCKCPKPGTTIPSASANKGVLDIKNRKPLNGCPSPPCDNAIEVTFEDNSEEFEIKLFDTSNVLIQKAQVVLRGTVEHWNEQADLVGKKDVIYIYTDWKEIGETEEGEKVYAQGFKIGDGKAYLIDTPFMGDTGVTITESDVERWNNKWRGYIDPENFENLVFTTE